MSGTLDESQQELIIAAQTLPSIDYILRELVDNSIDSGAKKIEVYFNNFGLDGLSIVDDGCGIKEKSFEILCGLGTTSKILDVSDIENLKTKGFRGKALFSISRICDLKISTKSDESEFGHELQFCLNLKSFKIKPIVMNRGTKIDVKNHYHSLPVRKKDLDSKIKSYFSKCLIYLQHACFLHKGIEFQIFNKTSGASNELIFKTFGNNSLPEIIINIFGLKHKKTLMEIEDSKILNQRGKSYTFEMNGIINCERMSLLSNQSFETKTLNRHFCFLNGRIWNNIKLLKRIMKCLTNFVEKKTLYSVLYITTSSHCDYNVSTNKEKIYVEFEDELIEFIVLAIEKCITKFSVNQQNTTLPPSSQPIIESFVGLSDIKLINDQISPNNSIVDDSSLIDSSNIISSTQCTADINQKENCSNLSISSQDLSKYKFNKNIRPLPSIPANYAKHFIGQKFESKKKFLMRPVPTTISINIAELKNHQKSITHTIDNKPKLECLTMEKDTKLLQEKISRHDFKHLEIVGQFNNGFIITRLDKRFYIVDQHGADERYNFDEYISNPNFQSQNLVKNIPLSLSVFQRHLFDENLDFFRSFGYEFTMEDDQKNIFVAKVPSTSGMTFRVKDLIDSIDSVANAKNLDPSLLIPMHLRDTMASKACRKSIMIGTPLNFATMSKIILNMTKVKYPWVCAHGRPIIQHVFNMD